MLHLHHAVWIINNQLTFAAGEEKTNVKLPRPYGWRHTPDDQWVLNHMVHNLLPNRDRVYLTYTLDFIPDSSPAAKGMRPVETRWLDVEGGKRVPGVRRPPRQRAGTGASRTRTTRRAPTAPAPPRNRMTIEHDGVLVQTAGHLHPGGLWTDLKLTRDGRTVNLFRSRAKYWEPAGAVSWDVAMTATRRNWRVEGQGAATCSACRPPTTPSARPGTSRWGSCRWRSRPGGRGGLDPFSGKLERRGRLTHGHLPENDNHGGEARRAARRAAS